MATAQIRSDWYLLEWINTVVTAYQKNGTVNVGRYSRGAAFLYVSECLVACDVSSIPKGSIINSVTCSVNLASTTNLNLVGNNQTLMLKKQDQGTWSDTPTTEPDYDTPFNTSTAWPASLSTIGGIDQGESGTLTIPTSAGLVSLVQGWVNGTGTSHDGLILAMNCGYYDSYIGINTITVDVTYTPPGAAFMAFMY